MIIYSFSRIIIGLFFFILGINGFLHFLPEFNSSAYLSQFIHSLEDTKYFLTYFYILEITIGFLLLLNILVPLIAFLSLLLLAHFTAMYYHLVTNDWQQQLMFIFYSLIAINLLIILFKIKKYKNLIK